MDPKVGMIRLGRLAGRASRGSNPGGRNDPDLHDLQVVRTVRRTWRSANTPKRSRNCTKLSASYCRSCSKRSERSTILWQWHLNFSWTFSSVNNMERIPWPCSLIIKP